ncbi:MAG: cyclase family protein [Thermoanaerobaculia bacterium]
MIIDISPPLDATIGVWPGDTPFSRTLSLDFANGDDATLSHITTTLHVGAHADAPLHMFPAGADIASLPIDRFIGMCQVVQVDVGRGGAIAPIHLEGKSIVAPRILFKTGTFPDSRSWNFDFAGFAPEMADWLRARGVVLVGIDTPSFDPFDANELEAHRALAQNGISTIEGLVLAHVDEGEYELIAPPLALRGADGSPLRALLRTIP